MNGERQYDLVCIGSCCVDLIFARLNRMPLVGTEEYGEDFVIKGGGGANTPVAAARLGLSTAFVSQIGEDAMGALMWDLLAQTGLSTEGILRTARYKTSVSAVLSRRDGERGFASYDVGGMRTVDAAWLERLIARARHVHTHIAYCKEYPILALARQYGCTVSLDTSWSETQTLAGYADVLYEADIFMPNEAEACLLTGLQDVEEAAARIAAHVKVLAVKLGARGALLWHAGRRILVPGVPGVQAVDTTGAGDCFNAGFLYGWLKGCSVAESARYANASGAVSVTFVGGMDEAYTKERVLRQAAALAEV